MSAHRAVWLSRLVCDGGNALGSGWCLWQVPAEHLQGGHYWEWWTGLKTLLYWHLIFTHSWRLPYQTLDVWRSGRELPRVGLVPVLERVLGLGNALCSHRSTRHGSLNVQGYCTTGVFPEITQQAFPLMNTKFGQDGGLNFFLCIFVLRCWNWSLRNVKQLPGATQFACGGKLKSKEGKWLPGGCSARIWWHRGLPFSATAQYMDFTGQSPETKAAWEVEAWCQQWLHRPAKGQHPWVILRMTDWPPRTQSFRVTRQ